MTARRTPAPPRTRHHHRRRDAAAALVCLVLALGTLLVLPLIERAGGDLVSSPAPGTGPWWGVATTLLVQAAVLAASRPAPRLAPVTVAALPVPLALLAPGGAVGTTTLAVLVAAYLTGVRVRREQAPPVAASMAVLTAVVTGVNLVGSGGTSTGQAVLAGLGQAVIVIGAPMLVALIVVSRRQARGAQERELAALRREQDARIATAIAAERTAVARDLHDIAAHHMSGIAMLASALERQVDRSPEAAKESARDIRAQSTAVLGDLRRLVGLLRVEDAAPLADRSLASLADLVEQRCGAGTAGALVVLPPEANPGAGVGTLAQLVGYRMVQESLANAAVHAPGARCEVRVDATASDRVRITVVNEAPLRVGASSGHGGFGLLGMRERAELVGAGLDHGPTEDGGWHVTLELPRERADRSAPPTEERSGRP